MKTTAFTTHRISPTDGMVLVITSNGGTPHVVDGDAYVSERDIDAVTFSEVTPDEAEAIRAEQEAREMERMRNEEARDDGTDH